MQRTSSEPARARRRAGCRASASAGRARDAFSLSIEDFALPARQRVLLVGPSGTGKSTFLSLLCGIVRAVGRASSRCSAPTSTQLSNAARDRFRAEHFGIIFQMFNLLPYGSILDNVLLPLELCARIAASAPTRKGAAEDEARAAAAQPGPRRRRAGAGSRRRTSASASSSASPRRAR